MKVVSYSLFGDPTTFEFGYYLRGCYFNTRMNRILLPEFTTIIYTTPELIDRYDGFWQGLGKLNKNLKVYEEHDNPARCEGMLWRMLPIWEGGVELVLCRDLDSVVTYREANCIYDWLKSELPFHAINDNDAHGGLMGGLVGFKAKDFLYYVPMKSFNDMLSHAGDLSKHGSDQHFLNKRVHPLIKHRLLMHKLRGAGVQAARVEVSAPNGMVDRKLWVSDLISRYIGSAGVIDFELIRFFQSFDKSSQFDAFEKNFKDICYWRQ